MRRRDLLILVGAVGAVYGLRAIPWPRGAAPEAYRPIPGLSPFRRPAGSAATPGAILSGVEPPSPEAAARQALADRLRADPCRATFGDGLAPGVLPLAYFSDIQCPHCRALERHLEEILAADPGLRLVPHEWPVFGPVSELAARALVAAERQDGEAALRRRLTRMPPGADAATMARLAESAGLDGARLLDDMARPEVQARLDHSAALAHLFGFSGTPGLVIGRTVLDGAVPPDRLRALIAAERGLPPLAC